MADDTQFIRQHDAQDVQDKLAADDIAGVKYLRYKLTLGADGVNAGDVYDDNPMPVSELSVKATAGGQSQSVSISGASAQSAEITAGSAVVTPTVDCFFRAGADPTALADGTDHYLIGGLSWRIGGITSGHKLAFITSAATGSVYITPGA